MNALLTEDKSVKPSTSAEPLPLPAPKDRDREKELSSMIQDMEAKHGRDFIVFNKITKIFGDTCSHNLKKKISILQYTSSKLVHLVYP